MAEHADNESVKKFRVNALGHHVPEHLISGLDMARDDLVIELAQRAASMATDLLEFKRKAFGDIAALITLSAESYQTTLGGKKGNVTLYSFDGKWKIQFAHQESIAFDERIQAARALIDECISQWSANSGPEIKALVMQAFNTDQEGKVSTARILALRRLAIEDERWKTAMTAIAESVHVVKSRQYVRFYQRNEQTQDYDLICLDMAAA